MSSIEISCIKWNSFPKELAELLLLICPTKSSFKSPLLDTNKLLLCELPANIFSVVIYVGKRMNKKISQRRIECFF